MTIPREIKTYVYTNTYTQIFKATLLTLAKSWKWPNVYQQLNRYTNCRIATQWKNTQQ